MPQSQRVRLSQFPLGEGPKNLAADVGVSPPGSTLLHVALQAQAQVLSGQEQGQVPVRRRVHGT